MKSTGFHSLREMKETENILTVICDVNIVTPYGGQPLLDSFFQHYHLSNAINRLKNFRILQILIYDVMIRLEKLLFFLMFIMKNMKNKI